jgi:hypothetical protein
MNKKPRSVSYELMVLRILNARIDLSEKDKLDLLNLEKGFEGELMFDSLTEKLQEERFILNDLLLKVGNTYFQIDTTIISQATLHFFEVKNYEGDFYYESGLLYKTPKKEIKDPILQLKKNESLMRQLLQSLKFQIQVEAWVIYINPEFTLFQAPRNLPMILPTQLNRFLKELDMMPSKLSERHKRLAEKLISLHHGKFPFTQLPSYDYSQLKKGVTCSKCHRFVNSVEGNKCVCVECGHKEEVDSAVIRNVREIRLLFPDRKITTQGVYEWCGGVIPKNTIRRVLKKHFKAVGSGRWLYYE